MKRLKIIVRSIRADLARYKASPDEFEQNIKESNEQSDSVGAKLGTPQLGVTASIADKALFEREYKLNDQKITRLNLELPKIKARVREFFELTHRVEAVFVELDDFYQLNRFDQPFIIDFVHRLCKDLPLFFKVGTLRHASALYADKKGQPFGAQERHDYQPINVDFTLAELERTSRQLKTILHKFGEKAGWKEREIDALFKGEGFQRLVVASGGVPRDFLSLLLEFPLQPKCIGSDEVRLQTRVAVQRRIGELKSDSKSDEQGDLLRGIYAISEFCQKNKTNVFLISEQHLNKSSDVQQLFNRLFDYRIIHSAATTLTLKKSGHGTFQAYMIDVGFYANLRKLKGRFKEYDITDREELRNAPVMEVSQLLETFRHAPTVDEEALMKVLSVGVEAGAEEAIPDDEAE